MAREPKIRRIAGALRPGQKIRIRGFRVPEASGVGPRGSRDGSPRVEVKKFVGKIFFCFLGATAAKNFCRRSASADLFVQGRRQRVGHRDGEQNVLFDAKFSIWPRNRIRRSMLFGKIKRRQR